MIYRIVQATMNVLEVFYPSNWYLLASPGIKPCTGVLTWHDFTASLCKECMIMNIIQIAKPNKKFEKIF